MSKEFKMYVSTIKAACELDCSRDTIVRRIKSGILKAKRFGRHYKIERNSLEEFKARELKDISA